MTLLQHTAAISAAIGVIGDSLAEIADNSDRLPINDPDFMRVMSLVATATEAHAKIARNLATLGAKRA